MLSLKNIYTTLKNVVIIIIAILCTVGMTTFVSLIRSAMANPPTFTVGTESIINIQNSGTALNLGDDSMSGMKDIGFDFTFYDQTFDQVNISMNGFFTFQSNFSIPRILFTTNVILLFFTLLPYKINHLNIRVLTLIIGIVCFRYYIFVKYYSI